MRCLLSTTLMIAAVTLAGCGSSSDADANSTDKDISLTVLAAASLQKSFDEIAEEFTAEHPNITVDFNYSGSSTLVQNLDDGAPADVFASADEPNMDKAEAAGLIKNDTRGLFAANTLVGIVPSDNPANISTLEEANADNVDLVICAPQVPCGALSQSLADASGITLNAVSEEQQVSDVLGKIRSNQADAGLVYATDAALAPDEIKTFDITGADEQQNRYPIAQTANSEHTEAANAFIDYVRSQTGRVILEDNGFASP